MNMIERTVEVYAYVKSTTAVSEDVLVSICAELKENAEMCIMDDASSAVEFVEHNESDSGEEICISVTGTQRGEYIESSISTDWYSPDIQEYVDGISEEETALTIQKLVEDAFFDRDIEISGEITIEDDSLSWMQTVDRVYNRNRIGW